MRAVGSVFVSWFLAFKDLRLTKHSWFNTGHMTSHTHEILAAELEKFLNDESDCGWKSW